MVIGSIRQYPTLAEAGEQNEEHKRNNRNPKILKNYSPKKSFLKPRLSQAD